MSLLENVKLTPRPGTKINYESSGVFVHVNRFQIKICMYPRLFETLKKPRESQCNALFFRDFLLGCINLESDSNIW